jgi:chromosome segregation ATPase
MRELVVRTLIKGLEEAKNSIQNLQTQVNSNNINLANIDGQLKTLNSNMEVIMKIVRGDGTNESLTDRVKSNEIDIRSIKEDLDSRKKESSENVQGKWQLKVALITSSFSALAAISVALLTFIK